MSILSIWRGDMIMPNPFTPKSGLEPRVFTGRGKEIDYFLHKVQEMDYKPADHYVIQGDWGMGKTVLIKELKRKAQAEGLRAGYIKIPKFPENSTLLDATVHLVRSIPRGLVVDKGLLKKANEKIQSLGIQVMGTGFQVSKKQALVDPQNFLIESLLELWNLLKKDSKKIPIFVDDVQNYELISEMLTLYLNALSDDDVVKTGYLFVLTATPPGWKHFLKRHHPIGRYFSSGQILKPLTKKETVDLVRETLADTGVLFDDTVVDSIYDYTNGHPYETQVLCSSLYESQIKGRVCNKEWFVGINQTLQILGESVFAEQLERASKEEYVILGILAKHDAEQPLKEIHGKITTKRISYESVGTLVSRLKEKGLVKRVSRGKYIVADKLLREYIISMDE